MNTQENPVNATQAAKELGWGRTRMSAVKRAMGIKGRYLFLSDVRKWTREHNNFTVDTVYPRKATPTPQSNRPNPLPATSGKCGEQQ